MCRYHWYVQRACAVDDFQYFFDIITDTFAFDVVFSPLNRHILKKGGGKGKSVAVLGFGGLGQMAIKIAKAMDVGKITVMSRSDKKKADAERMGCDYLVYSKEEEVANHGRTFDVVIDTVSAPHNVSALAKVGGSWVLLGAVAVPFDVSAFQLLLSRYSIEGSLIGGVPETQEMLDFCGKHNIVPEYQVIHAKDADAQFKSLMDGTATANRKVIDLSTLKEYASSL